LYQNIITKNKKNYLWFAYILHNIKDLFDPVTFPLNPLSTHTQKKSHNCNTAVKKVNLCQGSRLRPNVHFLWLFFETVQAFLQLP